MHAVELVPCRPGLANALRFLAAPARPPSCSRGDVELREHAGSSRVRSGRARSPWCSSRAPSARRPSRGRRCRARRSTRRSSDRPRCTSGTAPSLPPTRWPSSSRLLLERVAALEPVVGELRRELRRARERRRDLVPVLLLPVRHRQLEEDAMVRRIEPRGLLVLLDRARRRSSLTALSPLLAEDALPVDSGCNPSRQARRPGERSSHRNAPSFMRRVHLSVGALRDARRALRCPGVSLVEIGCAIVAPRRSAVRSRSEVQRRDARSALLRRGSPPAVHWR